MLNEKNLKMFEDKMSNIPNEIIEQSQNLLNQLDSPKDQNLLPEEILNLEQRSIDDLAD